MESIFGLVAVIVTVIGTATASTLWITNRLQRIERRLARLESEQWTGADMRSWARKLKEQNESILVPSVSDVIDGHTAGL